jgi:hypothetical protein
VAVRLPIVTTGPGVAMRGVPVVGITLCVLVSSVEATFAQDDSANPWFVRGGITPARVFLNSPFDGGANDEGQAVNWVPDVTVEIGRQTDGGEPWHHLYGLPAYGAGFSVAWFRNEVEHGEPLEAYAFFSWPFAHLADRLDLTTDFSTGLSWHWQQVNRRTDSASDVLGSDVNARIDWGFYLRYLSSSRTSVYAGIDFTHRSNGGMVQPDKGINLLGPKIAVRYGFGTAPSGHPAAPSPPFRPAWEVVVGGLGGVRNVVGGTGPVLRQDFGVFQTTTGLERRFYRYGKIAGGMDVTYDGGTGAKVGLVDGAARQWRADASERWAAGAYGGYEHVIGRFGAIIQVGYNVARASSSDSAPRLYERLGWRYQFNDRLWGTIAVRSDGRRADFLEFGAGYRFRFRQ